MLNIRQNVFETNSSSTHVVALLSLEQFRAWDKGEAYLCFADYNIPSAVTFDELCDYFYDPSSKYDYLREQLCTYSPFEFTNEDGKVSFINTKINKPMDLKEWLRNPLNATVLRNIDIFESKCFDLEVDINHVKDPVTNDPRIIVHGEIWD